MDRRSFLVAPAALVGCGLAADPEALETECPNFLRGVESRYAESPRDATLAWFRAARRGLFLRYGVYSQLRGGPSAQFDERIPLARYKALQDSFDPSGFDADGIAKAALSAGMRYIAMTAKHADGFSLFRTVETDFNCLEGTGRDLIGELSEACDRRSLGLFLTYSYAADWRHPYFYPSETARLEGFHSQPTYPSRPPEYRFEGDEDFLHYIRYAHNQLQEVAYRYRPLAGIRLEPTAGYRARPDLFPIEQTYSILREAGRGILVAFGEGVTGDEDYVSIKRAALEDEAVSSKFRNSDSPREIRQDLLSGAAGTPAAAVATLLQALENARGWGANLLVGVSLRPDGSLDPSDERSLEEFGQSRA